MHNDDNFGHQYEAAKGEKSHLCYNIQLQKRW